MISCQVTFDGAGYNVFAGMIKNWRIFISVHIKASDPKMAFEIAHKKLIKSEKYQDLISSNEHPKAMLSVHQYAVIFDEEFHVPAITGFVFYPLDDAENDGKSL